MAKEYIERETAIEIIDNYAKTMTIHNDTIVVYQAIRDIVDIICPTADVVEVKHGYWKDNTNGTFTCSVCGGKSAKMAWCGRCGAKMDGERKEQG